MVEGLGSAVLPQPYQQAAMPTPRSGAARASARARCQCGRRASRQSAMPTPWRRLAGGGGVAVAERVQRAELQAVDAGRVGEAVHQRLARHGGLRHPEAAEGAGDGAVGVDGAGAGEDVRHAVGAGGVDGDAVRHRGAPARIGAGVEDALEVQRGEAAGGVAAEPRLEPRGVALGAGEHGLRPGEGHAHRPAGPERGEAEERLQRQVELAAEAAADGGGDDADALGRQGEQGGGVVAVEVGRLGAGADHQRVAVEPGRARLGLDVGVLDEAGAEGVFRHVRGLRQRGGGVAAPHAALDQPVAGAVGMQRRRAGRLGGGRVGERRQRRPGDGEVVEGAGRRRPRRRRAPPPRRGTAPRPPPARAGRRRTRSRRSGSARGCRRR